MSVRKAGVFSLNVHMNESQEQEVKNPRPGLFHDVWDMKFECGLHAVL